MAKHNVVILYGGKSVEHEISIKSAKNIFQSIDKAHFEPYLIGISKQGDWHFMREVSGDFSNADLVSLRLTSGSAAFTAGNESFVPDLVFPVLHGTDGEDGSIQGLLQTINVPYAGSGVLGSSVAMSKLASKRLLQAAGIPTSKFIAYDYRQLEDIFFEGVRSRLGLPFMAKAANLGSSVGVVKVSDEKSFTLALKECFIYDSTVLFEEYIAGRELECSVMGNTDLKASLPAEIVISPQYEFYTYKAKYQDPTAVELKVPANLDAQTSEEIRKLSIQAYKALHCEDFARVDLFLTPENSIFINEVNTIPGFTNSSMFPMMWQEQGISFPELITTILKGALEKSKAAKRLQNDYKGR
ncbi:MAG: D-alanine--D-alanine ligase family protein [Bacteroidota bacterium]